MGQCEQSGNEKVYVRDIDTLMNPAVHLGDQISGVVDKGVGETRKEEIVPNHILGHCQLLLSLIEIKVDEKILEETRDGIRVLVLLHSNNLDQLLDVIPVSPCSSDFGCASRNNSGGDEVSEEMGT